MLRPGGEKAIQSSVQGYITGLQIVEKSHTRTCRLFPADVLCILIVLVTRHSSADAPAERYPGPAQPVDPVVGPEDASDAVSTDAEVKSNEGDCAGLCCGEEEE